MIFISYARQDADFARSLRSSLEDRGFEAWIDEDIVGGAFWPGAVEASVKRAEYLVVILTPSSIASEHVTNEVIIALESRKVIPVLAQSCEIPLLLRSLEYIDFTADEERALDKLSRALRASKPEAPLQLLPGEDAPAPGWLEEFFRAAVVLLGAWVALGGLVTLMILGVASLREGEAFAGILCLSGALGVGAMRRWIARFLVGSLYPKPKARLPKAST